MDVEFSRGQAGQRGQIMRDILSPLEGLEGQAGQAAGRWGHTPFRGCPVLSPLSLAPVVVSPVSIMNGKLFDGR